MWKAIRENPRAVTYAVLMHLVLLALLVIGLDWTPKVTAPGSNVPIQAELVTEDPLKQIEQRQQAEADAQRFVRLDLAAGRAELERHGLADEARQALRAAEAGDEVG